MNHALGKTVAAIACAFVLDVNAYVAPPIPNFSGLWWNAPAGSESGWGVLVDQQDDTAFAAWLTYDARGEATWFSMPRAYRMPEDWSGDIPANTFQGPLFRSKAAPVAAGVISNPRHVTMTVMGYGGFHFSKREDSIFWPGLTDLPAAARQWKSITPLAFGAKVPECSEDKTPGPTPNFQGMWWNAPGGSETDWGVYVAHQGDMIFAFWLTYSASGDPEWLSMELTKEHATSYSGPILRSKGPSHEAATFDPALVQVWREGFARLEFGNSYVGTFTALWDSGHGSGFVSNITRMMFSAFPVVCD